MTNTNALGISSRLSIIKVKDAVLLVLFFLLAFENAFQNKISDSFSYLDEGITALLLVWAAISIIMKRNGFFHHDDAKYLAAIVGLCIIGVTGNLLYKIQPNSLAILIDAITCLKFTIAFLCAKIVVGNDDTLINMVQGFTRAAIWVLLILMLANLFFDLGMSSGERLGFSFWFGHPSNFAATIVGFIALLLTDPRRNRWPIIAGLLILFSTGRAKAVGFAVILVIGVLFYSKSKRIPATFIIIGLVGCVAIAYDQIALYFFNSNTARSILLQTSLMVAKMFFPLGSGFASYGSNASGEYYTSFYYSLGFDKIYGLTPSNHDYLVDSFWPLVVGQFGFAGLIVFCIAIYYFTRMVSCEVRNGKVPLWAAVAIPLYLFIASTSESAFFASYAPYLALTLAIILKQAKSKVSDAAIANCSLSTETEAPIVYGAEASGYASAYRNTSR